MTTPSAFAGPRASYGISPFQALRAEGGERGAQAPRTAKRTCIKASAGVNSAHP